MHMRRTGQYVAPMGCRRDEHEVWRTVDNRAAGPIANPSRDAAAPGDIAAGRSPRRPSPSFMSSTSLRDNTSGPLAAWAGRLDRIAEIARRHGVGELAERAPHDCAGNVLWLVQLERWDAALDVLGGAGTIADALRAHFGRVAAVESTPAGVETLRERFAGEPGAGGVTVEARHAALPALPFADGEFDCLTLHDALDRVPTGERDRLFRECRRVLRPGGCLYVAAPNAGWHRRLRRSAPGAGAVWPARLARALGEAGFRETRLYYLEPSLRYPLAFVPATVPALLAFEQRGARLTRTTRVRLALVRAGLHPLLYQSVAALAYA